MCVTVRTLCLLVSSVSVILSSARAVIHDMLHLMVHQECDPSAFSQNGHDVGASSAPTTGATHPSGCLASLLELALAVSNVC